MWTMQTLARSRRISRDLVQLSRRVALAAVAALAVGALILSTGPAQAGDSAKSFIAELAQEAQTVLGDQTMSREARARALEDLMRRGLAVRAIGRHAMGPYLRSASPQQVAEFDALFDEYSVRTVVSKLDLIAGVGIEVTGERPDGPRGHAVSTRISPPGHSGIHVVWRVRERQDNFKIVDILVQNLSLATWQRSDFTALYNRVGRDMDAFLSVFRRKVESLRQEQADHFPKEARTTG